MFALNNSSAFVKRINASSGKFQKINSNKNIRATVISPTLTSSPFSIPDSPEYISIERINKTNNIYYLKKLEYEYDTFLEKKCQILQLLNVIDEVFEIRDMLIIRVNSLRRKERQRVIKFENIDFKI
jgi:hypothetical protein